MSPRKRKKDVVLLENSESENSENFCTETEIQKGRETGCGV